MRQSPSTGPCYTCYQANRSCSSVFAGLRIWQSTRLSHQGVAPRTSQLTSFLDAVTILAACCSVRELRSSPSSKNHCLIERPIVFKKINWLDDFGILVIRLMLGTVFVFHGSQKLFAFFDGPGLPGFAQYIESINLPYPAYGAVLAGAAELLGGLALITGFGMRTMTVPLIFTMGVASWYVHGHTFSIQNNGMEYPLTLGVILFGLACTGPGKFSLSRLLPERTAYQVEASEETRKRVLSRAPAERQPQPNAARTPAPARRTAAINTAAHVATEVAQLGRTG